MESSLIFIIFMAIVQGIAEFLPISSSGHLAIMGRLFDFDPETNASINIILHAGTLLSIIVYYFKELINILKTSNFKLIGKIIIATIPVAIVGLTVKLLGWEATILNNLFIPAIGLLITASLLLWSSKAKGEKNLDELSYKQSFLIGLAQSIAILPGISRAGSTISVGLKTGLKKAHAAQFSFLLAIPAIGGVVAVKLLMLLKNNELSLHSANMSHLVIAFAVAAITGYFALALLLKLLKHGDFKYFAWYLYVLGLATLALAIFN